MAKPPLRHYCTHFDRNYLLKGLALYRSLERHGGEFNLHIVCLDETTFELLVRLRLRHARLIRCGDFEDPALLAVKPTRTVAEYCWTCTPSVPLYVLQQNANIDLITYLDADLFFFSSPEPIFEEFGTASTLITEHRFAPRFVPYEVNGKYNVQWLTFRRDDAGMSTLRWWREKCIEWCFYRLEGDRMGDQKYLDSWPDRFPGVHVLRHLGGGVAPWNFSNYRITERNGSPYVNGVPVIFYHFHGFRWRTDGSFVPVAQMYLQDAPLPELIYGPYQAEIASVLHDVRQYDPEFSFGLEAVETATAPSELATRAYWSVPESCRAAIRKIIPRLFRARLLRVLGISDHRSTLR